MGDKSSETNSGEPFPVTSTLAKFIANADVDILNPELTYKLKEYILDYMGVTLAAAHNWDSTQQIYKGILALGGGNGGNCTVALKGSTYLPQYAGLLNATFGHTMDFDDTYAPGSLHAGVCAISAGLTQAELLSKQPGNGNEETDTLRFMLAVSVGYEVICRLGAALGNEAYERGFHNTSTSGIFGAVAAIAVLKRLSQETIENAFGLALSKAAGSMQYLENGSWNKRLHPGFAVHDAFVCVTLAEAGVLGAAKPIEGRYGLLHAYSPKTGQDLAHLVADLGSRWDFLETALKPYPACRMTHGLIEIGGKYGTNNKGRAVKKLTVSLSPQNRLVVGESVPNKLHPGNPVDAQFSAYFQLAHAWLYGSDTGVEFKHHLEDREVYDLSEKIEVVADSEVKAFGSKLNIEFADGQGATETIDIPYPMGEIEHPYSRDKVEDKYFSLADGAVGHVRAVEIKDLVDNLETRTIEDLIELIK